MTLIQAIILGLVQGLTEFIPISSTAHLRIVPALFGWPDPGAAASAVIQLGTLLAVFIYFFGDIVAMTRGFFRGLATRRPMHDPDSRLAWLVIIGTIPVVIFGLTFKEFIETTARNLWLICFSLIAIAIALMLAELYTRTRADRTIADLSVVDAVIIGLGQSLALIPGMSRSGSTIMAGLFRRLDHEGAARFSFLLSIPAIFGSGIFELLAEREHLAGVGWGPIAVAIVVSFVSGWASIWFLLHFLRKHTTFIFAWYRIALAIVLIGMLYAGYLEAM